MRVLARMCLRGTYEQSSPRPPLGNLRALYSLLSSPLIAPVHPLPAHPNLPTIFQHRKHQRCRGSSRRMLFLLFWSCPSGYLTLPQPGICRFDHQSSVFFRSLIEVSEGSKFLLATYCFREKVVYGQRSKIAARGKTGDQRLGSQPWTCRIWISREL